ncbi:PRC-barrel domain-containing protein [Salinimicrobium sp. CAU 1759]
MTRHRIMIEKWKYDEVGQDIERSTSRDPNEISAPLEHLEELKKSDYKISDQLSGIYGWQVLLNTGGKVGRLKDFLFDRNHKRIRYLVVTLEKGRNTKENKNILIPVGKAEINQQPEKIIIQKEITSEELLNLPEFTNVKSLAIEDEKATVRAFAGSSTKEIPYTKENFYDREEFREENFFGDLHDKG